ncbi:MAG: magnesium transporter MgtE [Desulfohalobiaceae bacterium]
MRWLHCYIRKGIFKLLTALLLLAGCKLALFAAWSVQELWLHTPGGSQQASLEQEPSQSEKTVLEDAGLISKKKQALAAEAQEQEEEDFGAGSLSQEWDRVRKKQKELQKKEEELTQLEERIDKKLARQKELKQELEEILDRAKSVQQGKIKHLVDVYSNMEPEQAANVLETLDQDIAVKILSGMRGRTAGEILSFVEADKAARLSEQLTDFQTPFED